MPSRTGGVALEIESISAIIEYCDERPWDAVRRSHLEDSMAAPRDYEDIPGTYVYDAERGRVGYHLNMFCMSLNDPGNRKAFKADEAAYLDRFPLTPEQKQAVLKRDWLGMLKVGGNIYYTIKIAFCDGLTFQDVAGMMCGMPKEEYGKMMLAGGRAPTPENLRKGGR
jgi:protocatechuate 4,5-dioxygenase alpha chain